MCGLVSIIARKPAGFNMKTNDVFEQMLMLDTLRGKDSTGVLQVSGGGNADVLKVAELPYFLFRSPLWEKFKNKAYGNGRILAGHNRAATRGNVTNENAHPFYEKNIIMMHNGTLDHGWESLAKDVKVEVDSHALCHALTQGTPEEVIPKVEGAFALLWYNLETEEFHAIRNEQRPLSLITTEDFYLLASESWMATIPMMRNQYKILDCHELEPGELHTWNLRGQLTEIKKIKLGKSWGNEENYNAWMARHGYMCGGADEDCLGESHGKPQTQIVFPRGPQIRKTDKEPRAALLTDMTKNGSNESTSDTKDRVTDSYDDLGNKHQTIKVLSEQYPRGEEVMCKILKIDHMSNGTWKWVGKISEPGKELTDCMGFLDRSVSAVDLPEWLDQYIVGTVSWVTSTTGGLSVVIRECKKCVPTLINMGKMIPERLWTHAHTNCKCRDCKCEIQEWEKEFTSVKLKGEYGRAMSGAPLNIVEVVCADCIMSGLEGKLYDRFHEAYYQKRKAVHGGNSAVQDRKSVGTEPVGKNGSTIVVPGPEAVQ